MSTLKHTIRHQQAQLQNLENMLHSSPRPLPPAQDNATPPSSYISSTISSTSKMQRRSSFEVLQGMAGADSSLPLPKRDNLDDNCIREGIPTSSSPSLSQKRISSSLSRIPVSAVGNARALAEDGSPSPLTPTSPERSSASLQPLVSPNPRRQSLTPGGTTKVLADLQTGVINARNALENTKAQLRLSQRTVAQLTRQTEDLREGRERLRLENEGLNNVVARKERLLQEVLERARKAEAEVATLKSQFKAETMASKKSIREMETALAESTALSQKSEREYLALRDSLKSMSEVWKRDIDRLRDEMRKREERCKVDTDGIAAKYKRLLQEHKAAEAVRKQVIQLKEEDTKAARAVNDVWSKDIKRMQAEVEESSKSCEAAELKSKELAGELARLRRLMRNPVALREEADSSGEPATDESPPVVVP
ncbi:hypothetical protein FISHEDRAFT_65051 [Fistulina hepatica ATCC 64428]|uniref:SWI5-dependent HO expression protein 3 n=1 Tax=Fistulina hepatica ATCC 64428 TaxID=1128425 RepID=A0A0D7AGG6_9AGAR|nr:hypothetical protein FISHEDRAFT_65051 [Fistulina hepatica ATCC 64428]